MTQASSCWNQSWTSKGSPHTRQKSLRSTRYCTSILEVMRDLSLTANFFFLSYNDRARLHTHFSTPRCQPNAQTRFWEKLILNAKSFPESFSIKYTFRQNQRGYRALMKRASDRSNQSDRVTPVCGSAAVICKASRAISHSGTGCLDFRHGGFAALLPRTSGQRRELRSWDRLICSPPGARSSSPRPCR